MYNNYVIVFINVGQQVYNFRMRGYDRGYDRISSHMWM